MAISDDLEKQIREINLDADKVIKTVLILVAVGIAIGLAMTSWVTIGPEERGVVLRFGKRNREITPGLHFMLPFGFDTTVLEDDYVIGTPEGRTPM